MRKQTLGVGSSYFGGTWTAFVRLYDGGPFGSSITLTPETPAGMHSIGNLTFGLQKRTDEEGTTYFHITPGPGVTLCDGDPNQDHRTYSDAIDERSCKSVTIAVQGKLAPFFNFKRFAPHEKAPRHWISIVNTPSGHAILFENGATPLFGHAGILRFQTIDQMKEKKKVGSWSFHLGSPSLPIIMEITRISQSATDEHNGNCDIVFRPVDGRLIRCFNGNPHLMGQHLKECSGFQISLEWQISHNGPRDFEVTNVTYLPLEQDK